MEYRIKMLSGECWFGGTAEDGTFMPIDESSRFDGDFRKVCPNETMPMYVSTAGRVIWADAPFGYDIHDGEIVLTFDGEAKVTVTEAGESLRDAFLYARKTYIPYEGRRLKREFFKKVQYNTWVECLYRPTEEHLLRYAETIIENGFEPGILIIDEGWHGRYGCWDFDRTAFPHPKEMVEKLHAMGFKVMLWVVPFVCADGEKFIKAVMDSNEKHLENDPEKLLFIRRADDPSEVAIFHWWNGYSAMLDMSNETDQRFVAEQLEYLMNEYGIDGFKFDGGAIVSYSACVTGATYKSHTAHELNRYWNEFASKYEYHEIKDTYCGAGIATIQRLADRAHRWHGSSWSLRSQGLDSIVPNSLLQGLIGHPFICPDMVGGGSWTDFLPGKPIDGELFVRWAQASAFFPMMQYSKAPWSCLSDEHCRLVLEAGRLHNSITDEICEMVGRAEISGEPILRTLEYNYPHCGYEHITDEFMLEDRWLVAPVVVKGARSRTVVIPDGEWVADDGKVYTRGEYEIDAPLERLIRFYKKSENC